MPQLKICLASSEIFPFAKTGGLADVSGALGKYLAQNDCDVRLVMPFYSSVDTVKYNFRPLEFARQCELWMGTRKMTYDVYTTNLPDSRADVYLIHCPSLYDRGTPYTNDTDEYLRFALLTRAAIELCQRMGWAPDVFHANDWQTALLPLYLKTLYQWDQLFAKSKTLLTIHNIGYQGVFPADIINDIQLADYYSWFDASELYNGTINFLRTGIMHADFINTVSHTYAREIQSVDFGEGLEGILQQRRQQLKGIVNGVDYDEWNPEVDPYIPYHFSIRGLSGKEKNKKKLLSQLGLTYNAQAPVIGMVSRLVEQKGLDLIQQSIDSVLERYDLRLVILGSGEQRYEEFLFYLQLRYPKKVVFYKGYNLQLSHLIEAGADMFLMPSRYEPCGLNQIYSLKYGTIPIVRKTGGLADTVQLYDWEKQSGTGFVFEHYNGESLYWALEYALTTFTDKKAWRKLMRNAMRQDYSWEKQVQAYLELYHQIITV